MMRRWPSFNSAILPTYCSAMLRLSPWVPVRRFLWGARPTSRLSQSAPVNLFVYYKCSKATSDIGGPISSDHMAFATAKTLNSAHFIGQSADLLDPQLNH